MNATLKRCGHGFDWRNSCPHGCTSHVTQQPHCEFEVHCEFRGHSIWMDFDTIQAAKDWMADPWLSFPGKKAQSDFGAVRMTLYRRIVEPWESLEEWTDHAGWHRV